MRRQPCFVILLCTLSALLFACGDEPLCGNGLVEGLETCDDGNNASGDGCTDICQLEYCGNGVLDPNEVCDDGNTANGDGCSASCQSDETCGNEVIDVAVGESCDDGNSTSDDGCSTACQLEYCGNGMSDPGETCDDGNTTDGDGCSANCLSDETCGNAYVDIVIGESCDDGNSTPDDGCSPSCQLEFCGNGMPDPGEMCDDGNTVDGDGCSANCLSNESCGNSYVDIATGESCDDGNSLPNDGCSPSCQLEYCGNGMLDPGEICDDGNAADGDGCSANCLSNETCGNSYVDTATGEECDDGNSTADDGCSPGCLLEYCGNGTLDAGEACDDGNNEAGDGCSANCTSDETCGNGYLDDLLGEVCDDNNNADADGCAADCRSDETCGNGYLDVAVGEGCDDGNTVSRDGCDELCQIESNPDSCVGYCDMQAPGGCWCDDLCTSFGNCCTDYTPVCNPTAADPWSGLSDQALIDALTTATMTNHAGLDYTAARDQMYGVSGGIGLDIVNGWIHGIYTGMMVAPDGTRTPGGIFNTEHSWPQSDGASVFPRRGDIHHLFPTYDVANSQRSNHEFGETVCSGAACPWDNGGSERGTDATGATVFQVRQAYQGDVARAHFYFSVRYQLPIGASEESVLKMWDKQDPPDSREQNRNDLIESVQGNRNPFVDYPLITDRISNF